MAGAQSENSKEAILLNAARNGNEQLAQQFSELTEPYRHELQVHCYRILGSFHDAEDLVQETFLRAWKRLETFEGRASFRSWLYKIATNACLDFLDQQRSRRFLPYNHLPSSDPQAGVLPPRPELTWLEPFPDEWLRDPAALNPEARYTDTESISLSFLTALQVLPPRQRAVLILRDVLDFSAAETAEVLEITVSSANSALHRARTTLSQRYQRKEIERSATSLTDERLRGLLDHFVRAWENADVEGLVALLKEDAILAMPPSPSWYQGRDAIRAFATATIFADGGMFSGKAVDRWRLIPTRANAAPAFALYQRNEKREYQAFGLLVLNDEQGELHQIISFIDPSLPTRFGLPAALKLR
ncbi:MAG TPA: sigma-70 family RNA polymerase sigma factor [Anaerolineales bacterium]|nr:sigma-70 family RNA polymerase sigma factor [Anaerolineales bacterium]